MYKAIAFFDLDGTITSRDTFIDFIIFCRGPIFFFLGLLQLSPFIFLFFLKLYPNHKLKELFFGFYLADYYSIEKLENLGKVYAIKRLPSLVYNDALKQLYWHKANNHKVIILTASSSIWLSEWCSLNELELIGTEFEKKEGKYTGRILGKNCHGQQKMLIVEKIIKETGVLISYGYGDTKADKPFLGRLKFSCFKPDWK